jgi:hypothetical protein
MYCFKIYGERNSGTNFLIKLIKKNFSNTFGDDEGNKKINNKYYFWKHGIPKNDTKDNKENKMVIKIFIFRKLEPWLVSMFYNPYHLINLNKFDTFLTTQITSKHIERREENVLYNSNKPINFEDVGKTIFQVRYYKYLKIKEYCENNENVILVNLEYLQNNDNCIEFLKELNNRYNFNKKEEEFKLVEKHTKNKSKIKNKTYETNYEDYQEIIDKHKNIEIENEINNLTYFMKHTKIKLNKSLVYHRTKL